MTSAANGPGRRPRTIISVSLLFVAVLTALTAITTQSVASTLLKRGAYDKALADADAYNRPYTQVLPDPQARDVAASLLAYLPVDRSLVTANLCLVLPTSTLRCLTDQLLTQALSYLTGKSNEPALHLDLTPVLSNVAQLANTYLGNQLASKPPINSGTIANLTRQLLADAADISQGRTPSGIPDLPLGAGQAQQVTKAIVQSLPQTPDAAIEPQLQVLIA